MLMCWKKDPKERATFDELHDVYFHLMIIVTLDNITTLLVLKFTLIQLHMIHSYTLVHVEFIYTQILVGLCVSFYISHPQKINNKHKFVILQICLHVLQKTDV